MINGVNGGRVRGRKAGEGEVLEGDDGRSSPPSSELGSSGSDCEKGGPKEKIGRLDAGNDPDSVLWLLVEADCNDDIWGEGDGLTGNVLGVVVVEGEVS